MGFLSYDRNVHKQIYIYKKICSSLANSLVGPII